MGENKVNESYNSFDSVTKKFESFDNLEKVKLGSVAKTNDIAELLFNEYDLIEKIKDDAVDNLIILKKFLVDYENILSAFVNKFNNLDILDKLHKYWDNKKEVIGRLIDGSIDLEPYSELENILNYTSDYYYSLLNNQSVKISSDYDNDNSHNNNVSSDSSNKFSISQIDELYLKLYDAINSKNIKKETVYRGRLIKVLKKNKELINTEYEKVKCLVEINDLLSKDVDFNDVIKVLQEEKNKNYFDEFSDCISIQDKFISKFYQIYDERQVKKKSLYKSALDDELKKHSRVLDERFSREFLEKKSSLGSFATELPNAIALSAMKLGNTINELREAKTNRMKISKSIQAMNDSGRIIATPFVYMGKFLVNNWYALYSVYKGVNAAKIQQSQEEQARAEAEKNSCVNRENINAERSNAVAEAEQAKAQVIRDEFQAKAIADAKQKQADAYAHAQEVARRDAERREYYDAYNKALQEQANAQAEYNHNAGTSTVTEDPPLSFDGLSIDEIYEELKKRGYISGDDLERQYQKYDFGDMYMIM